MIAEIIPFIRLPRTMDVFDYRVPKELEAGIKSGSIVFIPFRKRNILGFTARLKNKSNIPFGKLRSINKIIIENSLTERQFEFFHWMSENYATSPSIIIKMFFPFTTRSFFNRLAHFNDKLQTTNYKLQTLKHPWLKYQSLLVQYDDRESVLKEYEKIASEFAKSKGQLLILFPRLALLRGFYDSLPDKIKKLTEIYQATGIKQSALQNAFWRIKRGDAKIILGTRPALFAPFRNLEAIIIDHEESPDHKQEEPNPRYHPIDAAKFIQLKNKKIKTIYTSPLPSLERYFESRGDKIASILSKNFDKADERVEILDIRHPESYRSTYPFHQNLESAIREALSDKKSVFLLVNRRGESSALVCADCGWTPLCSNCGISLNIINEKKSNETLICFQCGFKAAGVPFCPQCQSANLKYKGLGIQKSAQFIKKLFPETPIEQITKEIKSEKIKNGGRAKIIIGTSFAPDYVDFSKIGLIGIVSSDGALFSPEFRAAERFMELLSSLASKNTKARMIIQTFSPDHKAFSAFKQGRQSFLENELRAREELNYPPFAEMAKLIIQDKERDLVESEASSWIEKNEPVIKENNIEIIGPIIPRRQFVRGRFRQNIILKTKDQAALNKVVKIIPLNWIIDKNPENLL